MRESFSEYKKTIESNLLQIPFLYSGDIISSVVSSYSDLRSTPLTSPSFAVNCINKIYEESFLRMVEKSKEVILAEESIFREQSHNNNFIDKLIELNLNPHFIFITPKSLKLFSNPTISSNNRPFPNYFYEIEKITGLNLDVLISPLIKEDEDEIILYVSNKPIQSLVYSIQNMNYAIEPLEDNIGKEPHLMKWKHEIEYNFYECDYISHKVIIRNVSKIRQEKLNKLLGGN